MFNKFSTVTRKSLIGQYKLMRVNRGFPKLQPWVQIDGTSITPIAFERKCLSVNFPFGF